MSFLTRLLDLIYPRQVVCINCGRELFAEEIKGLCTSCLAEIEFVNNYCLICGRELDRESSLRICDFCKTRQPAFDRARGIALYSGLLRNLILKFKYGSEKDLSIPLGELLALYFDLYYGQVMIDYIIPIPLHQSRKKERGYNQSALLAEELKKYLRLPLLTDCLLRTRASKPLYDLSLAERYQVIKDVFCLVGSERIKDKNILLIDDIFTTGATVEEASLQLKESGEAARVYVLTLATAKIV